MKTLINAVIDSHYFFAATIAAILVVGCVAGYGLVWVFLWLPLAVKLVILGMIYAVCLYSTSTLNPSRRQFG